MVKKERSREESDDDDDSEEDRSNSRVKNSKKKQKVKVEESEEESSESEVEDGETTLENAGDKVSLCSERLRMWRIETAAGHGESMFCQIKR